METPPAEPESCSKPLIRCLRWGRNVNNNRLQGTDVKLSIATLAENITKHETEFRAFQVTSSVDQIKGRPSEVWQAGWSEAEREKAINTLLRTNKLYRMTPDAPGDRIYTEQK